MEIRAFVVITDLYPGIAGQKHFERRYPGTDAGYALALDERDYQRIGNLGAYGNIGGGCTRVEAEILTESDPDPVLVLVPLAAIPDEIWNSLPPGSLTVADWQWMKRRIWNGQNHLPFSPDRARKLWAQQQFAR